MKRWRWTIMKAIWMMLVMLLMTEFSSAQTTRAPKSTRKPTHDPIHASADMQNISVKDNTFYFTYHDGKQTIEYQYSPMLEDSYLTGTLRSLKVRVNGNYVFYPAPYGGPTVELDKQVFYPWVYPGPGKKLMNEPHIDDNGTPDNPTDDFVRAAFRWSVNDDFVDFSYRLSLKGPHLSIDLEASQPKISGWTTDRTGDSTPDDTSSSLVMEPIIIPSAPYAIGLVRDPSFPVFFAETFDLSVSEASAVQSPFGSYSPSSIRAGQAAIYDKNTAGIRNRLRERLLITVSGDVYDVFHDLPSWTRVSSYRNELSKRVIYDHWDGSVKNWGVESANQLKNLKRHGLEDLLILLHNWQRYGFDVKLPDHLPPNPAFGGEPAMRALLGVARDLGYRMALHENHTDNYADAPSYRPAENLLNADGSFTKGWFNSATRVQAYGLKPASGLSYIKKIAPVIKDYGASAGFVDVLSAVEFGFQVEHDANTEDACKARKTINQFIEMMDYARSIYKGPFLGEGGMHAIYAGCADGVEGELTRVVPCESKAWVDYPPIVDYDLLRVHDKMVNYGPGYYIRFFNGNISYPSCFDTARANTIAFGRAGFIPAESISPFRLMEIFREYYSLRPIQELIAADSPLSVEYEKDGRLRTLSQALVENDCDRVKINWKCGATVWVNRGPTDWPVNYKSGQTCLLPQKNGWLVYRPAPDEFTSFSINDADGQRWDQAGSGKLFYEYKGLAESPYATAVMKNKTNGPSDLHSVSTLDISDLQGRLLFTQDRGSSNLRWLADNKAVYQFSDSIFQSTGVTYKDLPDYWRDNHGMPIPGMIEIWQLDADGIRIKVVEWSPVASEKAISWTAQAGVDYELAGPSPPKNQVMANTWTSFR